MVVGVVAGLVGAVMAVGRLVMGVSVIVAAVGPTGIAMAVVVAGAGVMMAIMVGLEAAGREPALDIGAGEGRLVGT